MKGLHVLVLLFSVVLLCSAVPALETVTCSQDHSAAAARLALHDINERHNNGFKFQLRNITANKMEMVDDGCTIELELDLLETTCHTVTPNHFEDCQPRSVAERAVMANCSVVITVTAGEPRVKRYNCDTRQVTTNEEMVSMCPDCPTLLPLNSPEGLSSVRKAIAKINMNKTNEHYYVLKEVGRFLSGYIDSEGMYYNSEFVIVETHCPMGSKIIPEACIPLCPHRARQATCRSSYSNGEERMPVECEYIAAVNTAPLGPGEKEPICDPDISPRPAGPPPHAHDRDRQGPPPHAHDQDRQGPPPHAHDRHRQGPPPHAHDRHRQGPPPHAHDRDRQGPPPHAHDRDRQGPPPHAHDSPPYVRGPPCKGYLPNSDPAIHPICPKPLPEPKAEQS